MGCMNIALVLVGAGAAADAATARGETPLHLAARAHQTDLVRVLLRNNAKVALLFILEVAFIEITRKTAKLDLASVLQITRKFARTKIL